MQSATVPATCGADALVPLPIEPQGGVKLGGSKQIAAGALETTQTPGAATVCARSAESAGEVAESRCAVVGSLVSDQARCTSRGWLARSPRHSVVVRHGGRGQDLVVGCWNLKPQVLRGVPCRRRIDHSSLHRVADRDVFGSFFVRPQLPSSVPPPLRDMLATWMSLLGSLSPRVAVTKSIPQMMSERFANPCLLSTRTAHSRAPGAMPTTPRALSFAPTIPATAVPWPFGSSKLFLPTASRRAVLSAYHVQLRPREFDPGVEHGHVDVHRPGPVARARAADFAVDTSDAVRQALGFAERGAVRIGTRHSSGLDSRVGSDKPHTAIRSHRRELRVGERRGVTLQRVLVVLKDLRALLGVVGGDRRLTRAVLQHDDVVARPRRGGAHRNHDDGEDGDTQPGHSASPLLWLERLQATINRVYRGAQTSMRQRCARARSMR